MGALWFVLAVALIGAGAAFLMLRNGGDAHRSDGGSPEQVVRDFVEAARRHDCDTFVNLVSRSWLEGAGPSRQDQIATCERIEIVPYEFAVEDVELVSRDGDHASVAVTADVPGTSTSKNFDLVNEDGTWKVDPGAVTATSTVEPLPAGG